MILLFFFPRKTICSLFLLSGQNVFLQEMSPPERKIESIIYWFIHFFAVKGTIINLVRYNVSKQKTKLFNFLRKVSNFGEQRNKFLCDANFHGTDGVFSFFSFENLFVLCFVRVEFQSSTRNTVSVGEGDSVNQVWRIRDNNDFSNFKNFSHFENVRKLALTSDFQRNKNSSRTVCLLKEEKLLIEKLAVIIGGFYQPRKCLIKYLREKRILKCTAQGFRPIVCLCQIIACNSTHPRLETSLLATKRFCNYN